MTVDGKPVGGVRQQTQDYDGPLPAGSKLRTWTFVMDGTGLREGGFRTRSAAARMLALTHDNAEHPHVQPDVIGAAIAAAESVEAQRIALDGARQVRDAAIVEAIGSGVGMRELSRTAGMTAARISQVVKAARSAADGIRT